MIPLLADEDVPLDVIRHLRDQWGFDVLRLRDYDRNPAGDRRDDAAVLSEANRQERAVLTHNRRHFQRLHCETALGTRDRGDHWGIITYRTCHEFEVDAEAIARTVEDELRNHGSLEGRYINVERWFQKGLLEEKRRSGA
jgi:hypothetical protein